MNIEHLHKKLSHQSPEAHALMIKATGLPRLRIERWINNPKEAELTGDDMDKLEGWVKGEYGHCSATNGYVRVKHATGGAVCLGVKPARAAKGKDYGDPLESPNVAGPMPTLRPGRHGKDLPSPEQSKIEAAKQADAARAKPRKKNPVAQMLRHIHHGG